MARSRLQVDERRMQLLLLGLELFADRTVDDLSIDEIARQARISKGLLYHYFPSKHDFFVETVRFAAAQLVERIDERYESAERGGRAQTEALQAALDSYLDYVAERGRSYATLIRGAGADPAVNEIVEGTRQVLVGRILDGLGYDPKSEPGRVTGGGTMAPLLKTALRGWIGFVEAASLDWLDHGRVQRDQLRDLMVLVLVGALRAVGVEPAAASSQ